MLWPSQDSSAQEPFFFQAAILFFKLAPALLRETSTLRTTCRACPAGSTCPPVASCLLYHTRVAPEAVAKLFSAHSPHKKAHCAQNELCRPNCGCQASTSSTSRGSWQASWRAKWRGTVVATRRLPTHRNSEELSGTNFIHSGLCLPFRFASSPTQTMLCILM